MIGAAKPSELGNKVKLSEKSADNKAIQLNKETKVALFCGGRGSASLIRELVRTPQLNVSLIVNGYDDGLSTGHLRDLTPNMLGPSDFRKNLSRLIDLYSSEQYALQSLLEMRFPDTFSTGDIKAFEDYVANPRSTSALPAPLDGLMRELHPEIKKLVLEHLRVLFKYQQEHDQSLNYSDCSLGNLVFAGAYLKANSNFNASIDSLTSLFHTPVHLVNATRGENRVLVAIKADGQVLSRESEIVGAQSAEPIKEFYLLEHPITETQKDQLAAASMDDKLKLLASLDAPVSISPEADQAIREADIIIYGPGTQFSSLLPSYRTIGMPLALEESRAKVKIFVCNIAEDHDIQGITGAGLVDRALSVMGDVDNSRNLITHVLSNNNVSAAAAPSISWGEANQAKYKSANVVRGEFESQASPGTHSGHAVVRRVVDLYERATKNNSLRSLEIYVDLRDRSKAVDQLMEEFLDMPWSEQFESVQLRLNQQYESKVKLPPYASVACDDYRGLFTEVEALKNWLENSDTDYLVTLTGDGEYRLKDIINSVQILRFSPFGAVYGSRVQSRLQFRSALDSAYGEHSILRFISFCGAFFFTALFGILFMVIFSDPFTGFRVYRRSKISARFIDDLKKLGSVPSARVTRLMLRHQIEIAEIPVLYRTFRGFTKPTWRLKRGIKNILGVIS